MHNAQDREFIKILVHDGLATCPIWISLVDGHLDVLEKTAQAMRRPNYAIEIGYKARWSSKVGTKRSLSYISSQSELDEFWTAYNRYVMDQQSKKRKKSGEETCEIIFRNMLDGNMVGAIRVACLILMMCT